MNTQSEIFIGKDKPLALANVSNGDATNSECNFAIASTKFGTDNCTNHHICSDFSLFVKYIYHLIEAAGVQGIAGSNIAKGIGTIVFIVTYNEGTNHKISLENVI